MAAFEGVDSLAGLLKMRAGSKHGGSTTAILEHSGFHVTTNSDYALLFEMLDKHRFDFLPRGVNEIDDELAQKKRISANLRIEPRLALYIPSATYVFVSPKHSLAEAFPDSGAAKDGARSHGGGRIPRSAG